MQTKQGKLIEALNRVEQFLDKNGSAMEGVVTSTAHQQFTASRNRLVEHMTAQNEHARGIRNGVIAMRDLRDRLIQQHMRPIAILATDALNQGVTSKGESVGLRVKATGGLKAEAKVARTNLKLLDTRIRGSVKDGALLAQWRNIRRVVVAATSPRALDDAAGAIGGGAAADVSSRITPIPQEAPAAA